MVFAPEAAPQQRDAFLDWYDEQTDWDADSAGVDLAQTAPGLQAFYAEMALTFPPLEAPSADGSDASDASEEADGTDYSIGKSLIYMTFAWDAVDRAHEAVFRIAAKHGLGFFDVSSDLAETWLPDAKGGLRIAHSD
jgi:hypothetical protein